MLARKGVLISDPSVERMTSDQWHFEALALYRKEKAELEIAASIFKEGVSVFKRTLIEVLGANTGLSKKEREESQGFGFVPMSMFVSRPEFLNEMISREKSLNELDAPDAEAKEQLQKELIDLDLGDFEPLFQELDKEDRKKGMSNISGATATPESMRALGLEVLTFEELLKGKDKG